MVDTLTNVEADLAEITFAATRLDNNLDRVLSRMPVEKRPAVITAHRALAGALNTAAELGERYAALLAAALPATPSPSAEETKGTP